MSKATVMKAIKKKCLDCCCGDLKTVKECPIPDCPLYIYRLGKDPELRRGRRKVNNNDNG